MTDIGESREALDSKKDNDSGQHIHAVAIICKGVPPDQLSTTGSMHKIHVNGETM